MSVTSCSPFCSILKLHTFILLIHIYPSSHPHLPSFSSNTPFSNFFIPFSSSLSPTTRLSLCFSPLFLYLPHAFPLPMLPSIHEFSQTSIVSYLSLNLARGRAFPNLCPWTVAPARACHRAWVTVTPTHGLWKTEGPALAKISTERVATLLWARRICLSQTCTQTTVYRQSHRFVK